jgi:polyribonucleotide nucleotidyltransferase
LKPHTPRIEQLIIDTEYIGAIIGPGGKIIQEIQRETGTTISIEEKENKGFVKVFAVNKDSIDKAMNWIKGIVSVPDVGAEYDSTVKSIMPYGAFVEFMPGKQGLLHISEVSWSRLENLDGILKEGDSIKVKLLEVDPKTGKYKLSRKVLMEKPEGYVEPAPREPRGDRRDRPERGGNDRGERRAPREQRSDRPERAPREESSNNEASNNNSSDADMKL